MAANDSAGKYISMVKVGEKGQIVIPKAARAMFDIKPGSMLVLLADSDRGIALISPDQPEFTALMNVMKGGGPDGNPVD